MLRMGLVFKNLSTLHKNESLIIKSLQPQLRQLSKNAPASAVRITTRKKDPDEIVFFKYKYGSTIAFLSRLKIYQTIFSCGAVPVLYSGYAAGTMESSMFYMAVGGAFLAPIVLSMFSHITRRLVESMHFNDVTKDVHITHITFFGMRKDILINLKYLEHLPPQDAKKKLFRIHIPGSKYLLFAMEGSKIDTDLFQEVFGRKFLKTYLTTKKEK